MSRINVPWRLVMVAAALAGAAVTCWAAAPAPAKPAQPRLEAVAETRLLMDGLAQANFRGLEKMLKDKPADADAWGYTRGQALLIAETGNLLLLRPPRNQGQEAWMDRSTALRDAAKSLAKACGNRDYEASRAAFGDVANACNRCHQTFRISVRIVPFAQPADRPETP
jgi:cytochrome c556